VKSEFDENESDTMPPELPKLDDKESQLDLPEDLNLDGADDAENTAADDLEGDFFYIFYSNWLIGRTGFYCGFESLNLYSSPTIDFYKCLKDLNFLLFV